MATPKRRVLITGCSDGSIGSALAKAFHNRGLQVVATARNPSKMQSLADLKGVETMQLDVLSAESIAACVKKVHSLDMLINNAGGPYSMPISDLDISKAKELFDLNVWSYLATTQAFLPVLLKSKSGMIVNHTSSASEVPIPFQATYNASKAAMAMFSDTLRLELEPFGIKVVDLKTGLVRTNFNNSLNQSDDLVLPPNSIYTPAREAVEKKLRDEVFKGEGMHVSEWARLVANDLLKKTPSPVIWRGESAWLTWLASILPHGTFDGTLKKLSGLDVVAKRVEEK